MEHTIGQREERFRAVWQRAADAMALSDREGIVVDANPAYEALYGYPLDEVIGHSFAIIFPEEERAAAMEMYRQIFAGNEELPVVETVVRRADGEERFVESRYDFLVEDGARVAMLSIIRDVSERRRLQQAQLELERQREMFLATAAHDLKTPLTSVKGYAQLLQRRLRSTGSVDPETLLSGLQQIEATATRMSALVDELQAATSIQMGQTPDLELRPTDLVALSRQVVEEQQLTTNRHRLVVESGVEHVIGQWDTARLERALVNLLGNAIKYSPEVGDVTVQIAREDDAGGRWAVLVVEDRGIGIPDSDLPHVFDRFHRASNVVGKISGTGIGLAGVKQIIEQHGGTIAVESTEGVGTAVTVRLPL